MTWWVAAARSGRRSRLILGAWPAAPLASPRRARSSRPHLRCPARSAARGAKDALSTPELTDASAGCGRASGGRVPVLDGRFEVGTPCAGSARVDEYAGRVELEVRDVERTEPGDPARVHAGRPGIHDLDGYVDFLAARDPPRRPARPVRGRCFGEPRFRERFRTAPATETGHHAYAGGLIQHTVALPRALPRAFARAAPAARPRPADGGGAAARLRHAWTRS